MLGADFADDHRVHGLKVGRVCSQAEVHDIVVELAVRGRAEVIFHIARAVYIFGLETAALKFVENRAVGLLHHIGENRQPTPVRHANNDFAHTQLAAALDDLFHRWDQAFAAIQTETFGAHVFDVQEFLEPFGLDQLVQDRLAPVFGKGDFLAVTFDTFLQPTCFFGVGNMHVLQRKGAAVCGLYDVQNLLHRRDFEAKHIVDKDRAIHVGIGKSVGFGVQLRMVAHIAHAKRVQISGQMAPDAVGPDQHQGAQAVQHGLFDLRVGNLCAFLGGFCLDLVACGLGLSGFGPHACQRAHDIAFGRGRPITARPRRAGGLCLNRFAVIAHCLEKHMPRLIDGTGIRGIARIHLFEVGGIVAFHKGRCVEMVVGRLFGHGEASFG